MAVEQNSNYGQIPTQFQAEQELRDLKTQTKQDKPVDGKPISVDPKITAGTPKTGPDYKPSNMSYLQKDMARINGFMVDSYRPDANKYNKLTTYNSSHYGQNFERYHAHSKFKQLGFSPFRNNEDFYNKNSSLWDDAGRAGSTAMRLAGLGFASTFTNWGSFLSDKPNTEEAEEMDRLMSIGSSSREGFGAKALNFGVNAGYTYGVMSEILAEEAALFLAGTFGALPSGGTTTAAAVARTGTNIGRAYKALKLLTKADDARQLWKAAKTVGGVAREWMPLSQTTSLLTQSGKAAAKWDSLDNMAKVSKTFGSFYRDLREINAVTSEAKLEGGTVQNEVTNQLMAEYRKKNGKDPDVNEAKNIAAQARKAGYLTSQANIAGIYVSNKIVLDRALKGLPGLKNLETAATRGKATFLFNKNWKALAQDPYTMVRGAKKFLKGAYYKQAFNPKNLGKGGLNYLSANLMEGTQEVYQEAVGKGITDYFINTYNNPNLAGSAYFRTMMESGLKSQASGQGLETFLSGFLMAGPMTMAQSGLYKGYDAVRMRQLKSKAQKFTADPANAGKENPYQKQIDAELEFDQKTLEAMNEVTKDPTKYFNALEKDLKIQRDLAIAGEQAALDGDEKFARDTRDASLIEHSIHLLNAGRFDVFQDQIKGLGSLSKEELQEAFGEDPAAEKGTIQERLQKVIARTNEIKDVYEQYQNTTNPYSLRDQPEDYLAFEQMRNVMISDDIHFKFVANRMTGVYDSLVNSLPFANASMADFAPLFSIGDPGSNVAVMKPGMRSEIELLSKEIEGLGDKPENAERKASLTKKRDNLQQLSGLSQLFLVQYKVTQSVAQNEELFEENNRALEETEAKFKNAFFNHMRILAEQSGEVVLDKDIQKAYNLYRDYWKLAGDKAIYANAINTFADPKMFAQMRARMSNAMKAAMVVRQEKLKESLAEYKKRYLTNNFFNDLFEKFNAFVDPDEAQAFLDDKEVPTKFYNAETLEEISFGDEAYKGILALIDEYDQAYFEETGKRFIKSAEGTVASFREKDKNDKRALNDLATEFGFSPTAETTSVNSRQVLQAIIDSDFADKDMKKLAQRLLATVGADEQIMFKMNHHTNSTFDPTNGIIVDPRFSAEGYNIGIVPIEFSILNAMMQKMTSDALTSDKAFNDAITNLRNKLSEAATDAIEKRLFSLALSDNQGFIAEVMTSPLLQQRLASIPYTETLTEQTEEAKTLWGSFIDEIKKMLERVFGAARAASVYDEAITVITNKLSQPGVAPSGMSVDEIETDEETVTEEDPALEELLKKGFEEALASMAPEDRVGMQFSSWKLTSPIAADIIKKYNAEKIKQAVGKQETGSVPVLTEEERKRQMTELGYTVAELNSMTEDVVNDIISNRIKKKITIARKTADIEVDFDAFLPAEDIVENAIDDLKRKLREANYKVFETRDAKGKVIDSWYARADVRGDEIPGTRHERVSNVVKGKDDFAPGAADRGTVIDELLRDYLSGQLTNITDFKTAYNKLKVQYPSAIFSEQMLEELFDKFRTVERQIKSLGLRVDARIPTLFGVFGPKIGTDGKPVDVAGSIDILAFNSLGQVYIIDLKTSTQDRRLHYKAEEELEKIFGSEWESVKDVIKLSDNDLYLAEDRLNPDQKEKLKTFTENPAFEALAVRGKFKVFFYKSDDIAQQNAYRELLKQVSGIEAKGIVIFPLITRKTGKTYTSVEFQKDENDKYTIHVPGPGKMDIYDVTGRENVITQYPDNPLSADKIEEVTGVTLSEAGAAPKATEKKPHNNIGSTEFNIPGVSMEGFTIDGYYYNVLSHHGRAKTLVNINGVIVPFYLTSGQGGKGLVPGWYPFGGIGQDGWLNKTGKADMETYYSRLLGQENADLLKTVAERLNKQYGTDAEAFKNPDADPTTTNKPVTSLSDKTEDYINSKLPFKPTSNQTAETLTNFENNMRQLGDAITKARGAAPAQTDIEAKKADIERRRQEELESENYRIITSSKLFSDNEGNFYKVNKLANGKTQVLIADENGRTLGEIGTFDGSLSLDTILNGTESQYGTRASTNNKLELTEVKDLKFTNKIVDKINAKYDSELADLEGTAQPAEETNEEKVAKLRAQEREDLRKAIPNIDNYRDTEGNVDKSKLSPLELQMYNEIYEKYDKLISPLLGIQPKTGTQPTKELTLNDIKPGDKFTDIKAGYQATVTSVTKDGTVFYDTDKVSGDMPFDEFIKAFAPSNKASAEETTKQGKTGTQTQMDFDELTLKVGDRVKVNTPKDGEGVIKEDRGDKVLLEDGRQVMKKSLTKLTQQSAAPKSIVTPELQGKVIYVTPSKESTEKLIDIPGVVYGNTILAKYVMGDFNSELINRIRTVAESDNDLAPYAQTVVNAFENGVTKDMFGREDLTKNLLYSITALETANWKEVKIEPIITIGIKAVLTNAWSKVMAEARAQADQGATVVFDNNDAAASNKVDIAFVGETDITQKFTKSGRYKYETALKALNKAIIKDMPSGKSIVDILQGNAGPDIQVSKAVQELAVSLFQATKAEFEAIRIELNTLKSLGVLDSVLQKQNLTADAVRKMMATKEQKLKELLDIDDINVGDVVEFNEKGTNFPGMVIAKVGGKVTVAKVILNENGVPTQSKDDLFNSKEISTFTAREVPYNIFPMVDQKPVVPTPDVKAQTDAAMQNQTDNQGDNIAQLNEDLEANKDKSASDVLNDFLNNINCKG